MSSSLFMTQFGAICHNVQQQVTSTFRAVWNAFGTGLERVCFAIGTDNQRSYSVQEPDQRYYTILMISYRRSSVCPQILFKGGLAQHCLKEKMTGTLYEKIKSPLVNTAYPTYLLLIFICTGYK